MSGLSHRNSSRLGTNIGSRETNAVAADAAAKGNVMAEVRRGEVALPCPCGGEPAIRSEGMVDFLKCQECGLEGSPFFDGATEWLVKDWNVARKKETATTENRGSGI
jgi:hypothetical protein